MDLRLTWGQPKINLRSLGDKEILSIKYYKRHHRDVFLNWSGFVLCLRIKPRERYGRVRIVPRFCASYLPAVARGRGLITLILVSSSAKWGT